MNKNIKKKLKSTASHVRTRAKLNRFRYLMPFILTVIIIVSYVGRDISGQSQAQTADDEDFRAKLTELNNDLIKLCSYIESENSKYLLEQISKLQQIISELTPEQLEQMEEIFSAHPDFFDAPKKLLSLFERIELERGLMITSEVSKLSEVSLEAVYIARAAVIPLESTSDAIPEILTAARIAAEVIEAAAKGVALWLEGDYMVNDASLQTNHRNLLEDHDTMLKEHDQRMQDIVNDVQFTLNNKVELRRVHLQVIELREKQAFLVYATEAGRPIADVSLISFRASERDPVSFIDVEVTSWEMIAEDIGTYILEINLPKELKNANLFKLEVQHAPDPEIAHFGSVLFDRSNQNIVSTGQ